MAIDLSKMSRAEKEELETLLKRKRALLLKNKISTFYPDVGPLRRELYPKHLKFFAAGAKHVPMEICHERCDGSPHRERCFLAANRVGKTEGVGAYETSLHLTGEYPKWWPGRKFDRPVSWWASGDTGKTTRDILQGKLLGKYGSFGTGMIPAHALTAWTPKAGVPEAVEIISVKHVTGGVSRLTFKSYDQKREAFQGTEQDGIWLDEECDKDIYVECLLRTMTCNGMVILTFTPLLGMTELIRDFLSVDMV